MLFAMCPFLPLLQALRPMSASCVIPSDPDISGIGVRSAIYIQNLLCFIPAVWALLDGEVSNYELETAETQSTTNLILAFAILISTIVQACTLGLTNYHATIVLSLSWMNNTNAFVYFLLYVHHKSGQVEPSWSAWIRHIQEKWSFLSKSPKSYTDSSSKLVDPEAKIPQKPTQTS